MSTPVDKCKQILEANIRFQKPVFWTTTDLKVRATSSPGQLLFEEAAQLVVLDNYIPKKNCATLVVLDKCFFKSCATSFPGQLLFEKAAPLVSVDNDFFSSCATSCPGQLPEKKAAPLVFLDKYFLKKLRNYQVAVLDKYVFKKLRN